LASRNSARQATAQALANALPLAFDMKLIAVSAGAACARGQKHLKLIARNRPLALPPCRRSTAGLAYNQRLISVHSFWLFVSK
jgi:hypothetical protein